MGEKGQYSPHCKDGSGYNIATSIKDLRTLVSDRTKAQRVFLRLRVWDIEAPNDFLQNIAAFRYLP